MHGDCQYPGLICGCCPSHPLFLHTCVCRQANDTGYLAVLDYSCNPNKPSSSQRCVSPIPALKTNYALRATGFLRVTAAQAAKPVSIQMVASGKARLIVGTMVMSIPGGKFEATTLEAAPPPPLLHLPCTGRVPAAVVALTRKACRGVRAFSAQSGRITSLFGCAGPNPVTRAVTLAAQDVPLRLEVRFASFAVLIRSLPACTGKPPVKWRVTCTTGRQMCTSPPFLSFPCAVPAWSGDSCPQGHVEASRRHCFRSHAPRPT